MKSLLFFVTLAGSTVMCGQHSTRSRRVISVKTVDEAHTYVLKNPKLNAQVISLNSTIDSTQNDKEVYRYKAGDVFAMNGSTYKMLSVLSKKEYRVSYVLLNANKLDKRAIDSTRSIVIAKAKQGVSFEELSKTYATPAENDPDGAIPEWFDDDNVMPELVTAVKAHKRGDVYAVDVPERGWYYVVRSIATRQNNSYKLLKVPGVK